MVLDGVGTEKSRIVPDQMELKWLRVNAPDDAGVESQGLDTKAISRIAVPVDFARQCIRRSAGRQLDAADRRGHQSGCHAPKA